MVTSLASLSSLEALSCGLPPPRLFFWLKNIRPSVGDGGVCGCRVLLEGIVTEKTFLPFSGCFALHGDASFLPLFEFSVVVAVVVWVFFVGHFCRVSVLVVLFYVVSSPSLLIHAWQISCRLLFKKKEHFSFQGHFRLRKWLLHI